MPFILGYFGKDSSSHAPKIRSVAHSNAIENGVTINHNDSLIICSGSYTYELRKQDSIISLANNKGLLAGKLFTQESYQSIPLFDAQATDQITADPSLLTKNYWGRYAGVLCNEQQQKITLVRDPMGLNTLFYMPLKDGLLFATEIHLLFDCRDDKPSMNWNYFADYVIGQQYAPALTPFNGLLELQPGMGLHYSINGCSKQELLWDIKAIKSKPIINESEFEEKLLHTLKECTRAWVKDSPGVCVELSGGTDSTAATILLKEVLRDDQKLVCVNYIDSKQPSSNEIEFAQEVAQLCNAPIFYADMHQLSPIDKPKLEFRPNRPSTFSLFRGMDARLSDIAQQEHCTEILNGQGGDHVFLASPPEIALADYWLQKGFKGSGTVLQELSGQYRMPASVVLWRNIKAFGAYYLRRTPKEQSYIEGMPATVKNKQIEREHYLTKSLTKYPQAKKIHFQAIAHAVAFAERTQRAPDWITTHPLLSQPVVELGLQIPTYQTFAQGFDRIFFRKAVSRVKKPKALWRHIKGQTTSTMISSLTKNADAIQKMLLEGSLMKAGLIDEKWLIDNFTQMRHGKIENTWPIVNLLSAQQWLEQWGL